MNHSNLSSVARHLHSITGVICIINEVPEQLPIICLRDGATTNVQTVTESTKRRAAFTPSACQKTDRNVSVKATGGKSAPLASLCTGRYYRNHKVSQDLPANQNPDVDGAGLKISTVVSLSNMYLCGKKRRFVCGGSACAAMSRS